MLTVRDLLADLEIGLLTGEAGLDLPVRWVHISELHDPTPWLSGGAVPLTTALQLDTPARQREFVARLTDHQLAALGIGTGSAHDHAPPALPAGAPRSSGAGTAGRVPEAWLVAVKDSGPLSGFDRLTLHQAVTIVALEMLRARVAGDTERRLAGDILAAVVRGELTGVELARRLEPFGLAERVAAIVVGRPSGGRRS